MLIPSTVISIGDRAFYGNQLTSATIPDSVTTMGTYAFYNNQLTSVTFAENSVLTSIGQRAFSENLLISVTIPDSVTTMGTYAFAYNQLTSLTIPDSVTSIENYAFRFNYKLVQIRNYSSVTLTTTHYTNVPDMEIMQGSTANDDYKNELVLSSDEKIWYYNIKNESENITKRYIFGGNGILSGELDLSLYTNSSYDYEIYERAFYNNQLTSVIISNSITSIGSYAFSGNNNLTTVTIDSTATILLIYNTNVQSGYLLDNAQTVYVLDSKTLLGNYITTNFNLGISDKTGYRMYVRNP